MNRFRFEKENKVILAISILLLVVGYTMMALGSDTLSVIVLILAYCVGIPLSFLYKMNEK